ncbi:uncharacterized protein LOC132053930 [Lycium ferocissimum]|uniref:uncharacterized protein LOC132053930 n=1 Tax=Lycium ferocissimum TaxID=112874 RepID=UPI002814CCBA|nr:uncharacterized protein LOC132053930 [Lycium ferocissimum]
MALRTSSLWKNMATRLRGNSTFATSTTPKLRSYAHTAYVNHPDAKPRRMKLEYCPVYVALGMIALQIFLGLETIVHQLRRSPNVCKFAPVCVKKSRREIVAEVDEPDLVLEEADKFLKKSWFRHIAHVQDFDDQSVMHDPMRGDVLARKPRAVTLKSVGVDPNPHAH